MYYKDYTIDKYAKGGIFKDKLIGSSPNYDGILKLLKQFFYSPNIFLTEGEIGGNYYVINNSKGEIKDYYVFFSKGRYRFFEKDKSNSDANILEKDYKLKQRISNNKKEIANLKKSTTESVENENTLKYALQNWVSSGTIASMTEITEYEEINDIRLEAIKILDKEGNKFYSINGLKDILQKAKESLKLKTNDKSINYAKNIKEGNKYGDWTLTYYKPISETIGAIRLVNQKTNEKKELIGDSLNKTWFTSYNGITIEEKNPDIVIEKVLELANKVLDESKTEDIEQVEINKESKLDKRIKTLEISLKYANSESKAKLEKRISTLKVAQKYEIGEDTENQDERALKQLNKLKEEGKLKRYVDTRGNGKKVYDTIVPNKSEKGMYKRYESLSQSLIGILQNEYLDEADVLNWLKKTMPKREMAKGGMMAKGGKFKEYKPKFIKIGYDYGKKAYHKGINSAHQDTEFNVFLEENVYPQKDNKLIIDYLDSYNKGWNDENYNSTDWLAK